MFIIQKLLAATSELTTKLLKFGGFAEISKRCHVQRSGLLILLLLPLVSSCKEFEVYEITKVRTLEVSGVKSTEAIFEGEVVSIGSQPIQDHGFLWSNQDTFDLNTGQRVSLGSTSTTGLFNYQVSGLRVGEIYYTRAYVQYGQGMLLGEIKAFKTLER